MTVPTYPEAPARFVNPADPAAFAWTETIRADLDTLRAAPADALTVVEARRARVYAIDLDDRISSRVKGEQTDEATAEALTRLDSILANAVAARDRIAAAIAATEANRPTDTAAELLAEARQDRAWRRIAAHLDTFADNDSTRAYRWVGDTAATAAANGDAITLAAMREELDAYAARRRWPTLPDGSGLSQAAYVAALPYETPVRRHALRIAEALAIGWPRIVAAFDQCRAEVAGTVGRTTMLPGFFSDESVYSS